MEKLLIFTTNHAIMKLIKLTALSLLVLTFLVGLTACTKDSEFKKTNEYSRTAIIMSAAQENNPANNSSALGSMDVIYRRDSKVLNYKVTWTGLTGNPILMHIHGQAPTGYNTGVVQTILSAPNPALFPANGTYSGTLVVDEVVVKEKDLLNGFYYMNIHTTLWPGGEIRGQIKFQ
jgi:hypothetical protein